MNYMPVLFAILINMVILKFYELTSYSTNLHHINITFTLDYTQEKPLFSHLKTVLCFLKMLLNYNNNKEIQIHLCIQRAKIPLYIFFTELQTYPLESESKILFA